MVLRPESVLSEALCLVTLDCPLAEAGPSLPPSLQLGVVFPQKIVLGILLLLENSQSPKLSIPACAWQGQFLCCLAVCHLCVWKEQEIY